MFRQPLILGISLIAALFSAVGALAQSVGVEVELEQFGIGGAYRPAELAAMRLKVTLPSDSPTDDSINAWVQWEVPNADGDIAEHGRQIALTRGRSARVWLYAPLDAQAANDSVWPIRVFLAGGEAIGRELGGARVSPAQVAGTRVESEEGMMAVIGSGHLGLEGYLRPILPGGRAVISSHESVFPVFRVRAVDLPDRWEGLSCLEALFWTDELPESLSTAQAEAIREWIRRGGHLVIVLPENTNPWALGEPMRATEFNDILPSQAPRRDQEVALSTLLPVLSKSRRLGSRQPDRTGGIRVFRELNGSFDAIDNGYEPLIALPDGRVIVVQRGFGHGRISLVGLDFATASMGNVLLSMHQSNVLPGGSLPEPDVFWNRILGRRADTPTAAEVLAIESAKRLSHRSPQATRVGRGDLFRNSINRPGSASAGLALAVLLFIGYWIVAGPGGFYLLKHHHRQRHAWLLFAASAALFTALAWGGVTLLRVGSPKGDIRHVTFLDHIARPGGADDPSDPQVQRAASWLTMYLPGYGDTEIGIASLDAQGRMPAQRDLLYSWIPPEGVTQTFPNVDRYPVDVATNPDDFAVPTRSTASQFYAHWVGGVDPAWGGMIAVDPLDPVRVEINGQVEELKGTIINNLPGDLRDVKIIWIPNLRLRHAQYALDQSRGETPWILKMDSGHPLNLGRMHGEETILQDGRQKVSMEHSQDFLLEKNLLEIYVDEYKSRSTVMGDTFGLADARNFMEMLSFFHQIPPPIYLRDVPDGNDVETLAMTRSLGRELDLSAWFVRPCLIVIGFLENSACPIPFLVDGRPVESEGLTFVRWILPLPVEESIAFNGSIEKDAQP